MTVYLLLTTIALLLYLQLGTYVFFTLPVRWVNLYFLLATLFYAMISLSILLINQSPETNTYHVYDRIVISALIGLPLLFIFLIRQLHEIRERVLIRIIRYILLSAGIILIVRHNLDPDTFITFSWQQNRWALSLAPFSNWRIALLIFYILSGLLVIFKVIAWRVTALSKRSKSQADLVLLAAILLFLSGVTSEVLLPAAGFMNSIFVSHMLALLPIAVLAYALIAISAEQYTDKLIRELIAKEISAYVIFFDSKGNTFFANRHALDSLGYGQFSIQKLDVANLFVDQEDFRFLNHKARLHQSVSNTRTSLICNNGKHVAVDVTTIPMRDQLGRYLGFVFAGMDVSHIVKLAARYAELSGKKQEAVIRNRAVKDLLALRNLEHATVDAKLGNDTYDLQSLNSLIGRSATEKEQLVQEMHHRVKNNLQIALSLTNLLKTDPQLSCRDDKSLIAITSRIMHLSEVHDDFYSSTFLSKIDFSAYILQQVNFYQTQHQKDKSIVYSVNSHDVKLSIQKALSCAIIMKELIDNANTHAFPDSLFSSDDNTLQPEIKVGCKCTDSMVIMSVYDNGQGYSTPESEKSAGVGMHIVRQLTSQFLNGQVYISSNFGTYVEVSFRETFQL